MGKISVWKEVERIVSQGLAPEIALSREMEAQKPRHPCGRPMNPPEKRNFQHYAGKRLLGKRPNCRARGCKRHLRIDQALACSDDCLEQVVSVAEDVLNLLTEEQILDLFDSYLGIDYRIVKRNLEMKKPKIPRRGRY